VKIDSIDAARQLANLPTPRSGANSPRLTGNPSPPFSFGLFNFLNDENLVSYQEEPCVVAL
jgi:hypothetical protein